MEIDCFSYDPDVVQEESSLAICGQETGIVPGYVVQTTDVVAILFEVTFWVVFVLEIVYEEEYDEEMASGLRIVAGFDFYDALMRM